eukprot:663310-Rhodomonas_salina.1
MRPTARAGTVAGAEIGAWCLQDTDAATRRTPPSGEAPCRWDRHVRAGRAPRPDPGFNAEIDNPLGLRKVGVAV